MNCLSTTVLSGATVITASARDFVDPVCFDESTGSAVFDATGSTTGDYFYSSDMGTTWTAFTPGVAVTDLPPNGFYDVWIAEVQGDPCPTLVSVDINNSVGEITLDNTVTDATCANNDGAIQVISITGGSGSYEFDLDGTNFANLPPGNTFGGLSGGEHILTITDTNGCSRAYTITIGYPGEVDFTIDITDPDCSDPMGANGEIRVTVNETGTFDIILLDMAQENILQSGTITIPGTVSYTFTGLIKTDYRVSVLNTALTCPDGEDVSITGGPEPLTFDAAVVCNSNKRELSLTNITGEAGSVLRIELFDLGGSTAFETIDLPDLPAGNTHNIDLEAISIIAGTYEVQLSQMPASCGGPTILSEKVIFAVENSLSAVEISKTESYPDRPNGRLTIGMISGGAGTYMVQVNLVNPEVPGQTYSTTWEAPELNPDAEYEISYRGMPAGTYLVEVTDLTGCIFELTVVIELNDDLFVPNIFTPNGDEVNDVFYIRNLPPGPTELFISNRWGRTIYTSNDYQNNWDADGVQDGIYYYQMVIGGQVYRGWVEVQRGPKPGN